MEIKKEIQMVSTLKDKVHSRGGKLFNAYVSGSNLYGWNSKDSDLDIRGCFILNKKQFFGLKNPHDVIEIKTEDKLDDIVLFEIKKVIMLALKGNCNILEEINAPQFYKQADFLKLKQLVNNAFGKNGIYHSYRGLAEHNYKKFILQGKNTVKKYLYVFRGLMAGIYCLSTGVIQSDLGKLNDYFKVKEVGKLLEIKKKGLENEPLKELNSGELDIKIKELFDKLDEAYIKSKIPEKPSEEDVESLEKWLIKLRENNY